MATTAVAVDCLSGGGGFISDIEDEDLVYFLLNVGDGDMQVVLLPTRHDSGRFALIVDVENAEKLDALLDGLMALQLLRRSPSPDRMFPLVCATHPHHDHIAGMAAFLDKWHGDIGEFWEPGYRHSSASFFEMMNSVEVGQFQHAQPTSGFTKYLGLVRLTVLTPAIGLRNRFDTYGVDINDSSIALKIDFPASRVEQLAGTRKLHDRRLRKLILGADALMLSWGQALIDWPELHADNSEIAKTLAKAQGASPLKADLFKIPHHASKHGISVELLEQIDPRLCLLSCGQSGGRYNFPHDVALDAIREAQAQIATKPGETYPADHLLGIHSTGDRDSNGDQLGSIAVVIGPKRRKWHVWRFRDAPGQPISLWNSVCYSGPPVLQPHG
jgi:hypothetical protein